VASCQATVDAANAARCGVDFPSAVALVRDSLASLRTTACADAANSAVLAVATPEENSTAAHFSNTLAHA
jgi:hypothetical protein